MSLSSLLIWSCVLSVKTTSKAFNLLAVVAASSLVAFIVLIKSVVLFTPPATLAAIDGGGIEPTRPPEAKPGTPIAEKVEAPPNALC